jgi:MFS transporter, PAT family, beta-lactamase induction signal transducer AmpG
MRAPMDPTSATQPADPEQPTPPWMFLFLDLPFGAAVGFLSLTVPFWMERRGYGIDAIATVSAGANLAHAAKLAWIPILDLGSYRKLWYLGMAALNAALFVAIALMPDPLATLPAFAILLTVLQAVATTGHAANNALMATTTRFKDKGKVGGFAMASNVGSTGLLGALAIVIADRGSARAASLTMAAIVLASAAMGLRIVEPRLVDDAVRRAGSLGRATLLHVRAMMKDLWQTITSREGFTGLLICLAPVGCQAMSNLFTGIATQYGADADTVSLANGLGGGIASAVGALLGGVLADRMSRRLAYALSGGLTALCALAMAFAPMTPWTYVWGTFTYLFAGGIAFATWAGMVLEMVGLSAATATKYALFNASANLAISYVTQLDGSVGSRLARWLAVAPARGVLLTDAVLTLLGIAFLLAMVFLVRSRPRSATLGVAPG